MLRDNQPFYTLPKPGALNVSSTIEVDRILEFVDNNIGTFSSYYHQNKNSVAENWISNLLVRHFQICKIDQDGFLPYDFSKNPPQSQSGKETDIGVYVNTRNAKPIPIIEFEAKRFSESSNNKEYVCGDRGGMERFKRGHHSSHLKVCGMLGYIQSRTAAEWITKVNDWLGELSANNTDATIDWTNKKEQLISVTSSPGIEKLSSLNVRKQAGDEIFLWHYFIDLN
jgi:hypothetical protein